MKNLRIDWEHIDSFQKEDVLVHLLEEHGATAAELIFVIDLHVEHACRHREEDV